MKSGELSGIFSLSNQFSIPSNSSILKAYLIPEYNNPFRGGTQELASGASELEPPRNNCEIVGPQNQKNIMKLTVKIKLVQMHVWLKHTNLQHFTQL